VKYNVSVTFCSVSLFVAQPRGKTTEPVCTLNGSKRVKSGKDVPFGGFVKNCHPHPHWPPNSENFALRKPFFSLKTRLTQKMVVFYKLCFYIYIMIISVNCLLDLMLLPCFKNIFAYVIIILHYLKTGPLKLIYYNFAKIALISRKIGTLHM